MRAAQEPDRLPLGKILLASGVTLLVFAAGIVGAGVGAMHQPLTGVHEPTGTVATSLIWVGAPGLERDASALEQWRWVDRDAGIAHIPIDRAIDLTLKERK